MFESFGQQELILTLMIAAAVGLLLLAAFSGVDKNYLRRIERAKGNVEASTDKGKDGAVNVRLSTSYSDIAALDRIIRNLLPNPEMLRQRLKRAAVKFSLGTYLAISGILGCAVFGIASIVGLTPLPANILIGLGFGIGVPHMVIGYLIKRRQSKFLNFFPDAIELMVRGIKSGLPVSESITNVGTEIQDPVGEEFRIITDAVKFGRTLEEAMWEAANRLDLQEFKFFTISLAVQAETGGNLAETLNNLADVLRGRRQLKLKIKALSSEAKASAMIIGVLPFVMGGMIYLVNPNYIMKLFIDPRGHMLLGIGLCSFVVGIGVMIKMVKFEI
ncbi:MAG: type II secretion system F family protein [Kiloniellales bacterium]|nr:type II secretion system F family protein [Kiloniellales bacterium]